MAQHAGGYRQQQINIEKDWTAFLWSIAWGFFLLWIPTIVVAVRTATTSYRFTGHTLCYQHGLITRKTYNLDLYRVRSISAMSNPFSGGKLVVQETNGEDHMFPYVKNAAAIAEQLREGTEDTRAAMGVTAVQNIM